MKYYKIIKDNVLIGVVNSYNFLRYQPRTKGYVQSNELNSELVEYNNKLYHDTWMYPVDETIINDFEIASIIEISEEEYNTFQTAIELNKEIPEEEYSDEYHILPIINPIEEVTIDAMRQMKLNSLSYTCRTIIELGFDLALRGESYHFSLSTLDLLNLMNLNVMAQTEALIPYHADGEACIFYTADEIKTIVKAANDFKTYHTTYYNALKAYINALDSIEDIAALEYGSEIPDEYKSDVLKMLEM